METLNSLYLVEVEREAMAKHLRKFPQGWTPSRTGIMGAARSSFYRRVGATLRLRGQQTTDLAICQIEFRLRELVTLWQAEVKA